MNQPVSQVLADAGVCAAAQFEGQMDKAPIQVGLGDLKAGGVSAGPRGLRQNGEKLWVR
jgi:hypothetical protein